MLNRREIVRSTLLCGFIYCSLYYGRRLLHQNNTKNRTDPARTLRPLHDVQELPPPAVAVRCTASCACLPAESTRGGTTTSSSRSADRASAGTCSGSEYPPGLPPSPHFQAPRRRKASRLLRHETQTRRRRRPRGRRGGRTARVVRRHSQGTNSVLIS